MDTSETDEERKERFAHIFGYRSSEDWDTQAARYREIYEARMEWHKPTCKGRHGIVRNVTNAEWQAGVAKMLEHFFGQRGKAVKNSDGTYDIEVVDAGTRAKNPWDYCGTSILFEGLHQRQLQKGQDVASFKIGTLVAFTDRAGIVHRGMVTRYTTRVVVTEIGTGGTWYVPPKQLTRI